MLFGRSSAKQQFEEIDPPLKISLVPDGGAAAPAAAVNKGQAEFITGALMLRWQKVAGGQTQVAQQDRIAFGISALVAGGQTERRHEVQTNRASPVVEVQDAVN